MSELSPQERLVSQFQTPTSPPVPGDRLITDLLAVEKQARYHPPSDQFQQLLGTWQLRFVTGTKKVRQRAGVVLGAGQYLPNWVGITLAYEADSATTGRMINRVSLGALTLVVSGPCRWQSPRNLLAFDFTRLEITLGLLKLFQGYLGNGAEREAKFFQSSIGKQAFFVFFLLEERVIAARGKGGGLALWVKT
ncbi:MAG: hypothetical protein ACO36E_03990 [Synechocystis sp.]